MQCSDVLPSLRLAATKDSGTFRQTLGLATLKDIFYSCDVFEGAEKHILPLQAGIEPGESYFHLRLSARIFNFKILPEPGLQSRLFRSG